MPEAVTRTRDYSAQRPRRNPPQVSLADLRAAVGLTLDQVVDRLRQETGHGYTRGAISAIENGHRGASAELVQALCAAYGLPPGAIRTDYEPRRRTTSDGDVIA